MCCQKRPLLGLLYNKVQHLLGEKRIVDNYEKTPYHYFCHLCERQKKSFKRLLLFLSFFFVLTRKRKLLLAIYKDVSVIHMLVRSFIKTFDFKKFFSTSKHNHTINLSIFENINSDNVVYLQHSLSLLLKSMIDSGHFSRWYPPIH